MKKRWSMAGKMAVCSFAAMMMVMIGMKSGMTVHAEMIMDSEEDLQTAGELAAESENKEALPEDIPAVQEAGEEIDLMQVVVIEEEMVPGAAQPGEDAWEEAEAEELYEAEAADVPEAEAEEAAGTEEQQDAEAEEEAAGTEPEASSETGVSGTLTYEDSEVMVTVIASEAAQLPADTEVKVTRLAEGSAEYEAAKEAARQSLAAGENASYTFYDVTLESEGQVLDVEEGTVSVKMEFRTDAEKREVVSIEETENGKTARNVTDTAAAGGKAGSVALSY